MHFDEEDIENLDKVYRINLINSCSGYKSANLIGSVSKEGVNNLAIFSSITHLGSNPPLLGFFLRRYGFSPAPIIMGIVLGELVENSLAQSIIIFDQNIIMFFTRPICLLFFGLTFLSLFYRPIKNLIMKGKKDE